jgi:hypothetical protein
MNTFTPSTHSYEIAGRPVPSVTQVIHAVLGDAIWYASDFYLGRGQAVHACAALIAQGKSFSNDPQIDGQVAACRLFFQEVKPEVLEVEATDFCEQLMFGMTLDLRCRIDGREVIVDYKGQVNEVGEIQVGGYSLKRNNKWGMIVALQENGRYKCGEMFKADRKRNEFHALLTTQNIRKRLGQDEPGYAKE